MIWQLLVCSGSIAHNVPALGEGGVLNHKCQYGERILNIAVNIKRSTAPPLLPNVCWQQCFFCQTNKFKQMEDIIFVKRTNKTGNCRTYNNPVIKLEYPTGRFLISQKLADILNVDNDNGLMFGFNQKAKTGFVIKDDEPDAFILRRKDKHSLRFTSKDLQSFFIDTFELLESGKSTFYFNVSSSPNDRGLYAITWDV